MDQRRDRHQSVGNRRYYVYSGDEIHDQREHHRPREKLRFVLDGRHLTRHGLVLRQRRSAEQQPNKFGEYRGKACLSPKNVPICRGPSVPYSIQSMIAGGDGNLWFAEANALAVGVVNVNKPKHAPSVLNLPSSLTGSIESLVPGPGKTMYALVYGGSTTTVVTLGPGPSLTKTVSTPSIPSGVDIAGYSSLDGNLYVVDDSSGAVWSIAPATGTTTQILSSPGLKSGDPSRPMTLLKDGSLAYIGFSSVNAENEIGHIVPGRKPYPVSFVVPVQGSASGGLNGVWSIEYQGSDLR